jgi:archaellum component FlaC
MTSPRRPCTNDGCRTNSRTLCVCCEKYYCLDHLNEHFSRINNQIPPLSDKINGLSKRLTKFSSLEPSYLVALEKWRDEAHRAVEEYYETKRRDFIDDRREKLKKEIERVRNRLDILLQKHNAVRDDVEMLTQDIRLVEQKFNELQSLRFTIQPLVIDDNLIVRDILPLHLPGRTMKLPFNEFPSLASNEKHLLIHRPPNLSLLDRHLSMVKETPWTHDDIWDICWSSTLERFVLVTNKDVFTLDQNMMTIARCSISSDVAWSRGTCSDSTLFLLTQGLGPSIFEYKLPLSSKGGVNKERHPPETCDQCEYIFDLKSNNKSLAMVIYNTENDKTRLDLRSSINFEHLWSVDVGQGFRCCLLHNEQWMVVDALNHRLFHISNNGKLLKSDKYAYQPWNIIQWGKYIIGIRTAEGINLH